MLGATVGSTGYIGWGGKYLWVQADQPLGNGSMRGFPEYGIRRAGWDACFGFVNGFRLSAIAYYVVTRSLSKRFCRWAMEREGVEFTAEGVPRARSITRLSASAEPKSDVQ